MASEQPQPRAMWASAKVQGDALWAQLSARLAATEAVERDKGVKAEQVRLFHDEQAARAGWARLARASLDVAQWPLWWSATGRFALYGEDGAPLARTRLASGDYVRDDTHRQQRGPSWLWVEAIDEVEGRSVLTLRPSADPTSRSPTLEVTSHYYTRDAAFEVGVTRRGAAVAATVDVRAPKPNVHEQAGGTLMAARNDAVVKGLDPGMWHAMADRLVGL